jgi:hypothetical protein
VPEENHGGQNRVDKADGQSQIRIKMENALEVSCDKNHSKEKDAGENKSGLHTKQFHWYLLTSM